MHESPVIQAFNRQDTVVFNYLLIYLFLTNTSLFTYSFRFVFIKTKVQDNIICVNNAKKHQ